MPIKVILDTNVFRRDKSRRGQAFKTLGNLCKKGHVELVLPYIIKREFETQLDADAAEIVADFESSSKRMVGVPIPEDVHAELSKLISEFKARREEIVGSYKARFSAWLNEHAATELPLTGDQALAAMESYFVSGPPFQAVKERKDIPDAMIYQSLVGFAAQESVVFVSSDAKLSPFINMIEGVVHYNDLNAFVASEDVQTIIAEQKLEDSVSVLRELEQLASVEQNPLVEFVSERGGEQLASTSFRSPSIPGDDHEAYIYMFGSLDGVEFDWSDAAYHGDYIYTMPFSGEGYFNISYYVPKWDLVDIERRGGSYSAHNDYVVEAYEEALLSIKGVLRIKISDAFIAGGDLEDAIEDMAIDSLEDPILAEDAN